MHYQVFVCGDVVIGVLTRGVKGLSLLPRPRQYFTSEGQKVNFENLDFLSENVPNWSSFGNKKLRKLREWLPNAPWPENPIFGHICAFWGEGFITRFDSFPQNAKKTWFLKQAPQRLSTGVVILPRLGQAMATLGNGNFRQWQHRQRCRQRTFNRQYSEFCVFYNMTEN